MGGDAVIGAGADEDVGFEDDFVSGFDEAGDAAKEVEAGVDGVQDFVVIVGGAFDNGDDGLIHIDQNIRSKLNGCQKEILKPRNKPKIKNQKPKCQIKMQKYKN